MSYLTIEAIKATEVLKKFNISCELIDLRSIKPIDWEAIKLSLKKTGRLLVLDTGFTTGSVAGEIIAKLAIENHGDFKMPPERMAMPDVPEPTSYYLTKEFYITQMEILAKVVKMLKLNKSILNSIKSNNISS